MFKSEDISAEKIKSGFGGYKKKATEEFISSVRNEYENLFRENMELKEKLSVLSEGVQYYKNMESSLQKALVLAERTTTETVHAAEVKAVAMEQEAKAKAELVTKEAKLRADNYEKEAALKADNMIKDAKRQADAAVAEGNEELRRVHSQIMTLVQQYEQYKTQYKQLAMAQMNVLESEAYTLDAPILKTIQNAVDQKNGTAPKEEPQEHTTVVEPVMNVEPTTTTEDQDTQNEKKVYVDGRGQVVEVHEFREVSIPEEKNKDIDDFFAQDNVDEDDIDQWKPQNEGKMSFDPSEKKTVSDKQPVDYFKPFDSVKQENSEVEIAQDEQPDLNTGKNEIEGFQSGSSFSETMSTEQVSDTNYEQKSFGESDFVDNAETERIKRIERMQLDRLQKEEEELTQRVSSASMEDDNKQELLDKIPNAERMSPFEIDMALSKLKENEDGNKDDLLKKLHQNDDQEATVSLNDLARKDEEANSSVPLPKASEEQNYFEASSANEASYASHNVTEITGEYNPLEEELLGEVSSKQEADASTMFYSQFSPDKLSALNSYEKEEEKNSLDFEMNHASSYDAASKDNSGFKSFRDFESEL